MAEFETGDINGKERRSLSRRTDDRKCGACDIIKSHNDNCLVAIKKRLDKTEANFLIHTDDQLRVLSKYVTKTILGILVSVLVGGFAITMTIISLYVTSSMDTLAVKVEETHDDIKNISKDTSEISVNLSAFRAIQEGVLKTNQRQDAVDIEQSERIRDIEKMRRYENSGGGSR